MAATGWKTTIAIPLKTAKNLVAALQKNVLTAKKGRFLGVLAEKRGFRALKKPFYFEFFGVLELFCLASR
jgi:hypothetical protein